MAIRAKNLDLNAPSMYRSVQMYIGDVTATLVQPCFAAPQACKIKHIDIYSKQGVTQGGTTVSLKITARLATNSDATLQTVTTSATDASAAISANARYRLTPSANNSFTQGQAMDLLFSFTGTAVLSAVVVATTYVPLTHKGDR